MRGICISLNLKNKINKEQSLNIVKIYNKRLSYEVVDEIIKSEVDYLLIEEVVVEELSLLNTFENFKVIILVTSSRTFDKYKELDIHVVNILDADYVKNIEDILLNKIEEKVFSLDSELSRFEYVVIGMSLDKKLYSTFYLLNIAYILSKEGSVLFLEKEGSLINYSEYKEVKSSRITYQKYEEIEVIQSLKDYRYVIIDIGVVEKVEEILSLGYKSIVFSTNCKKVRKNKSYLHKLRLVQNYPNVLLINRIDIFDKLIQKKDWLFKSSIIKKHIKKNFIKKEKNVIFRN